MIPISIQHVVKTFGSVRALDDVSLEINNGEMFFLLGPSGCGKTTLLRTIAGFNVPSSGSIFFGKVDVTSLRAQDRNTGMVFQNYALWPHMTVAANVEFGLNVRRIPRADRRQRVEEALHVVKMTDYAKRKPNQLSGGQQQRVALARALVIRPQCLLLDEPLSNLDAKLRLEMRSEIRRICKQFGLTAVCVTHDQKEALSMADRMAVLRDGQVMQIGTPTELYRHPNSAGVADFLGETNFLDGDIKSGESGRRTVETPLGMLTAAVREGVPSAGQCTISIRPEAITLAPSANGQNTFKARVAERVYLGDSTQVALRVGQSTRLLASIVERGGQPAPTEGDEITLHVEPDDVVLLRN